MKIGVISDIHANLPALESVLSEFDEQGISEILCAGDLVGYYPYPNQVLKIVSSRNIKSIRGNHDEAILTKMPQNYNNIATTTLNWTRKKITGRSKEILKQVPVERVEKYGPLSIYMVHGSPCHPLTEYIYPEDIDREFVSDNLLKAPDFLVVGHTHQQFSKKIDETIVLNPGSVGQPRDRDSTAAYAVIDTEFGSATLYRTAYNMSETQDKLIEENLPKELAKRLTEGK